MAKLSDKKLTKMKGSATKAVEEAKTEGARETAAEAAEAVSAAADQAVKAAKSTVKTADSAKADAQKAAKAVSTARTEVYIQAHGGEASVDELTERAAAAFKAAHKRTKIEDMKLYVNSDERKAYYVVNGVGGPEDYVEF